MIVTQEEAATRGCPLRVTRRTMTMDELCADMRDIIDSIRAGSDRINRIVTDLKDFGRLDDNLPLGPVAVNQVIDKA